MKYPILAAVIQHACVANKEHNLLKTQSLIEEAKTQGAKLILLPELHATPYFCQDMHLKHYALAESLDGPTANMLQKTSEGCVLVGSIFEKSKHLNTYHNTALIYDDGQLVGTYRKMHIPDDPGYAEKYYFTPGECFKPIQTSIGKLGVLICWDQWFPEAARIMALNGADFLLYPTAIGWDPTDSHNIQQNQLNAWKTIQFSHSVANHLPVLSANRIGLEKGAQTESQFWGNSFICQAFMQEITTFDDKTEGVLLAPILQNQALLNQTWPFFRDRRTDSYQDLLKRSIS